jgi:hypothetical protein
MLLLKKAIGKLSLVPVIPEHEKAIFLGIAPACLVMQKYGS